MQQLIHCKKYNTEKYNTKTVCLSAAQKELRKGIWSVLAKGSYTTLYFLILWISVFDNKTTGKPVQENSAAPDDQSFPEDVAIELHHSASFENNLASRIIQNATPISLLLHMQS